MTNIGWPLVESAAQLLARDEREAVLGDLAEAGENAGQALLDVVGLVIRRQALLWKSWQPWVAAFGVTLPSSFLLMGISLSVTKTYQHYARAVGNQLSVDRTMHAAAGPGIGVLICQALLLIGLAWTGGFVVGWLSRRTLWMSAAFCFSPCLFCLARFRMESPPRASLLLFLLPAVWGVLQGLRRIRIHPQLAAALALAITLLMLHAWSSRGEWVANWLLIWPAWYMAATAWRASRKTAEN